MTWFSGARLVQGACCDLVRRRRGSAQPKVHEERFARRNTFRREFGLLLRCVARRSQIAGAKSGGRQFALWAVPAPAVLGGTSCVPLFSQTGGTAVELRLVGFPCRSHPRELPPVLRLPPGVADQNHKDFSAKNRSHKKNQTADHVKTKPTTRPGSASRAPDASQKANKSAPRNSQTVSLFSNAALK